MTNDYIIVVLFASIFIIVLAFFTTRLVSGGFNQKILSRNIKFIERLPLGLDKSLILVQLDKHFYLIYISKNGVKLIDKIDSLEIKDISERNISFSEMLSKFRNFKNK